MSEKLYAVKKNHSDEFLDFLEDPGFWAFLPSCPTTPSKKAAEQVAYGMGGHVVTFVEEPEKEVLSKEQAKVIERAHGFYLPATFIANKSGNDEEEELLMNAYVNGYTVAKEKKYNVKVPYAEGWHFQKYSRESKRGSRNDWKPFPAKDIDSNMSKELFLFTEAEIEHYGLQDCEKEEVTDDAD